MAAQDIERNGTPLRIKESHGSVFPEYPIRLIEAVWKALGIELRNHDQESEGIGNSRPGVAVGAGGTRGRGILLAK